MIKKTLICFMIFLFANNAFSDVTQLPESVSGGEKGINNFNWSDYRSIINANDIELDTRITGNSSALDTKANSSDLSQIIPGADPTKAAVAELADTATTAETAKELDSYFVDGEARVEFGDNTNRTPAVDENSIYLEGGVFKKAIGGVESDLLSGTGTSLPDQTSHSGEYLTTDGTIESWAAAQDAGAAIDDAATDTSHVLSASFILGKLAVLQASFDNLHAAVEAAGVKLFALVFSSPAENSWHNAAPDIQGTSSVTGAGNTISGVTWELNGSNSWVATGLAADDAAFDSASEPFTLTGLTGLAEGLNTVAFIGASGGDSSPESAFAFNYDSVDPVVALAAGTHDGTGETITISDAAVTDINLKEATVSFDGAGASAVTLPYDVVLPADTLTHTITLTGEDEAGNITLVGPVNFDWTAPAAPPSDDFERVNAANLGPDWGAPDANLEPEIVSGVADGKTAYKHAYWITDSFADDQYSQVTCIITRSGGPAVRMSTVAGMYTGYALIAHPTDYLKIVRIDGAATQVDLQPFTERIVDGTSVLKLEIVGNVLTAYLDGVALSPTHTDTSNTYTSGAAGAIWGVNTDLDNWEGGDL